MINKKGEITTQQIILLIVLIASFAIILFFILNLDFKSTSDKEICHNSVALRSASKNLVGKLDCNTNYVCISGGGECSDITVSETIEVDVENKQEIMKAIADEMVDCWWMFGEGELNYVSITETPVEASVCGLCSVVKFDSKVVEESAQITYREFYEYLAGLEKSGAESYLEYLYETSDVNLFQGNSPLEIDIDNSFLVGEDKYAIVTGYGKTWAFKDNYLPPHYLKLNQLSSSLNCVDYVTKA